ncbi:Na+/H+ antiporter subunit B [Brumimicrobium glaciale]|jgi:multicomponent Na+:H+ antiporter subunit B|uniref:Na+/H+ antiporter subunit B n=1 Tax=Brumimicrobium glaciale TaxID=200475 RepID=A0A4Q4KHZ1_9FLAO|nr:Na+/H+ antiporter subunit B [Brumimicrobium glaciale]RYM32765.1 Na+/H+ antiporter subunit B [Brumimicrobium glaciale]
MKSLILKTVSKTLLPLLILFSVFVLLRGHYLPGGGFVGGLIAAVAFILHAFANGLPETKKLLRIHPGFLIPIGLTIAILSALAPIILTGDPLMTGLWQEQDVPVLGKIGSALFFDMGVYFVVVGVCLTIIFTISESV